MNHFQTFYEFWRKVICPRCEATNWLYDSHSQRAFPHIPNSCECHACQNRFFIGDEEEFKLRYSSEIEEYGVEETLKSYLDFDKGMPEP